MKRGRRGQPCCSLLSSFFRPSVRVHFGGYFWLPPLSFRAFFPSFPQPLRRVLRRTRASNRINFAEAPVPFARSAFPRATAAATLTARIRRPSSNYSSSSAQLSSE